MNQTEFCLQRLLRSARRASVPLPAEAPFELEAHILSAWRDGSASEENRILLRPVLRRAVLCACAILVISTVLTLRSWKEGPADELMIVDTAIQLTLTQ